MNKRGFSRWLTIVVGLLPFLFLGLYFISDNPVIRMLSLALCVALILIGLIYFPLHFTSHSSGFKSRIERAESLLLTENSIRLKQEYQKLHDFYDKLPLKRKQEVYGLLTNFRTEIEEIIRSAKLLEELTGKIGQGGLEGQKQRYEEMQELYQTLPQKEQEKWYPHLSHAKELLERGQ